MGIDGWITGDEAGISSKIPDLCQQFWMVVVSTSRQVDSAILMAWS